MNAQPLPPSKIIQLPNGTRLDLAQVPAYGASGSTITFTLAAGGNVTYTAANAPAVLASVDAVAGGTINSIAPVIPISDAIVPTLTSDSSGSAVCTISANSEFSGHAAWYAFNGTPGPSNYWSSNDSSSGDWVKIALVNATTITSYEVTLNSAKSWQFQGSNDNSTWTTLDDQSETTSIGGTYAIANPTEYSYYRIYFTVPSIAMQQLQIYGYAG